MGRKRIYENNAARQKAYRERHKQEGKGLDLRKKQGYERFSRFHTLTDADKVRIIKNYGIDYLLYVERQWAFRRGVAWIPRGIKKGELDKQKAYQKRLDEITKRLRKAGVKV